MGYFIILTYSRKSRSKFLWPVGLTRLFFQALSSGANFFFLSILIYTEWLGAFRVNHSNHSYLSWTHMNANPSGMCPSRWICILSCMGCMFLAGIAKQCLLFCETSLTSSILCEAGEEGTYKGHTEEQCPSCCSPRVQQDICELELLLNVPLGACVMRQSTPAFPPKESSCSHGQEVLLTEVVSNWQSEHIQVWGVPHTHFFMGISRVSKGTVCSLLNILFYLSRQRNNCMRKVNMQ